MSVARAVLVLLLSGSAASAQAARVSGIVLDDRQAPVQGAMVRLTGEASQTTNSNGRFQFTGVVPGRYLVVTTAIGHHVRSIDLTINGDTTLTIVLSRRSVTLDTMVVRPRSVRIRGTAVDSATGDYLIQAQATIYPGGKLVGATSGVFVFDSVAPGPVTIIVEGLEHLPARVDLEAIRDTSFRVKLGLDSIALRMIAIQVKRLQTRSSAVPMPTTSINRDAIAQEPTESIGDLITRRLYEDPAKVRESFVNSPDSGCFFLDDVKVSRGVYAAILPQLVERVEIYRSAGTAVPSIRGRSREARNFGSVKMVRVYTKRFVATLPRQERLPRIVYMEGTRVNCV